VEKCLALVDDEARARRLARNAFEVVEDAYRHIDERVEQLLGDFEF